MRKNILFVSLVIVFLLSACDGETSTQDTSQESSQQIQSEQTSDKGLKKEQNTKEILSMLESKYGEHRWTSLSNLQDIGLFFRRQSEVYFFNPGYEHFTVVAMPGADGESFEVDKYSSYYGKDKNYAYFGNQTSNQIDLTTFESIGSHYAKDKNGIYHSLDKIDNADIDSFEIIDDHYSYDKNGVYYHSQFMGDFPVEELQILSVNTEKEQYAKNNEHAFYMGNLLENADSATFKVIYDPSSRMIDMTDYAKDKAHIYYHGSEIQGADSSSFAQINANYSKDKDHVYLEGKVISGANPDTYEIPDERRTLDEMQANKEDIGKGYMKDGNNIYYEYVTVNGANPDSFTPIDYGLGKDQNNVYHLISIVEGADPQTFEVLDKQEGAYSTYAKDKNAAYRFESNTFSYSMPVRAIPYQKIEGADPNTFTPIDYTYSKDQNSIFFLDKIIDGADLATFEPISNNGCYLCNYSKDANSVYRYEKKIEGADPETFQPLNNIYSMDKNGYFMYEKMVEAI